MKKELRKMKKFRFELFHDWIVDNFEPCRVADIGGGKGLLSFLLNNSGFQSTVIDPYKQSLPQKYKTLGGKKIKISEDMRVPRIDKNFEKEIVSNFDLLIGLHAHGSNMKIIEAAAEYKKDFILLPCCVIDEPITIQSNIDWFWSLEEYAKKYEFETKRFELNFKGQNRGIYYKHV